MPRPGGQAGRVPDPMSRSGATLPHVLRRGGDEQAGDRADGGGPVKPTAGAGSLADRLSPGARRLAEVSAVLGPAFSVDDLAEVLGTRIGQLLPDLRELTDSGLLTADDRGLVFTSEPARRACHRAIAEPIRLALHREIGALLLARGEAPLAAAEHLAAGATPGDRTEIEALDRANGRLAAVSPGLAADTALLAVELTDREDAGRFARVVVAVDSLVAAQRIDEAAELARSVLLADDVPPLDRARLLLALASIQLMDGHVARAITQAHDVVDQAGLPDDVYAEAEVTKLTALVMLGRLAEARQQAEAILGGVNRPQCDTTLAGALTILALVAWTDGRPTDALALLNRAVQRADTSRRESRRLHPRLGAAFILATMGEFEASERLVSDAYDEIEATADGVWAAGPAVVRSFLNLAAGRLDAAVADARRGLRLGERGSGFFVPAGEWVLACVALHRGDLRAAAAHVSRYRGELAMSSGWLSPGAYLWVEARLADARGDRELAATILQQVFDRIHDHRRLLVDEPAAAAWLVRAALAVGDRPRAEAVVLCADQLAATNPTVTQLAAVAMHVKALLTCDPDALARAAGGYRHPWARASAHEDAGVVLGAAGERDVAQAQLETALACYRTAGAVRDADRMRARIDGLATWPRRRRHGLRPGVGWASLTDTERRVALVIADGRTNAESATVLGLSRHTVDFHLRQIFRKLGIRSRVELTRIVIENHVARSSRELA